MSVKLLQSAFVPSSISIKVFQSFIESIYLKFATTLRKNQIEENFHVAIEELLIDIDGGILICHEKFMN